MPDPGWRPDPRARGPAASRRARVPTLLGSRREPGAAYGLRTARFQLQIPSSIGCYYVRECIDETLCYGLTKTLLHPPEERGKLRCHERAGSVRMKSGGGVEQARVCWRAPQVKAKSPSRHSSVFAMFRRSHKMNAFMSDFELQHHAIAFATNGMVLRRSTAQSRKTASPPTAVRRLGRILLHGRLVSLSF